MRFTRANILHFILGSQLLLMLVGCLVQPPIGDATAIATYNNAVVSLLTPVVATVVSVVGVLILWIKSNIESSKLQKLTEDKALAIATETKATAVALAAATEVSREKVLDKLEEQHRLSYSAIDKANHTNEKILALQEQAAIDREKSVEPVVQKVEIVAGPGLEEPLVVKIADARPSEVVIVEGPGPEKPLNVKVSDK